jgi:hypothetical protein
LAAEVVEVVQVDRPDGGAGILVVDDLASLALKIFSLFCQLRFADK